MRTSSFLLGLSGSCLTVVVFSLGLIGSSCTLLDPPLSLGGPRQGDGFSQPASNESGSLRRDTLMLVSAVSFPDSYDWQRDSAYGRVQGTVKLYCNGEERLSVPAGPGTDASTAFDGHHIIGNSLYTAYSDASGTAIGRDGERLSHWPEREVVCGLLDRDDGLYSLGTGSDGSLTLRCDGRKVLSVPGGIAFGGFGADTYGPTGALYDDNGAVCFAYMLKNARGWTVSIVADGDPVEALSVRYRSSALDARRMNGRRVVLFDDAGCTSLYVNGTVHSFSASAGARWTEAGIVEWNGVLSALGKCEIFAAHRNGCGVGNAQGFKEITGAPDYVFYDGGSFVPLNLRDCAGARFLGRSCASLLGGSLALALTPRDGSISPYVLYRGVRTEYPVHGFLSGVAFQITD